MAAPSRKGAADHGTLECTPLADRLAEIIFPGNAGSDLDAAAKHASIALEHDVPVDVVRNALLSNGHRGSSPLGCALDVPAKERP
jgi:hypothetical protein